MTNVPEIGTQYEYAPTGSTWEVREVPGNGEIKMVCVEGSREGDVEWETDVDVTGEWPYVDGGMR